MPEGIYTAYNEIKSISVTTVETLPFGAGSHRGFMATKPLFKSF